MRLDHRRSELHQLLSALAGVSVFGLSFGLLYPLMALQLESRGYSPAYIGVVAAMQPIGLILSNFLLPSVAAHLGVGVLLRICVATISLVFVLYPFLPPTPFWFVLRFLHGALASSLYVVSEAIILRLSLGSRSSRVMAIYTSVMQASFGLGPLILMAVGVNGALGFLIGAILTSAGGVIMLLGGAGGVQLQDDGERRPFLSVLWQLRIMLVSYAVFAFSDAVTADLLPIYGRKLDFSTDSAALLLTIFLFGSTCLQLPLSWLFDRLPEKIQLPVNVAGVAICFGGMILSWDTWLIWPVTALAGALTFSINTLGMAQLGRRLAGSDLIAGTASQTTVWGVTALVATPVAGVGMDIAGPQAMPWSITLFAVLSLALSGLLHLRRRGGVRQTDVSC